MAQSQRATNIRALPTPYQLGLLIKSYGGQISSLWNGFQYVTWRRRDGLTPPLKVALTSLAAGSMLAYDHTFLPRLYRTFEHPLAGSMDFKAIRSDGPAPLLLSKC